MKNNLTKLMIPLLVFLASCTKSGDEVSSSPSSSILSGRQTNPGGQNQPGVITAGEWNDLSNWNFWTGIINKEDFKKLPSNWQLFTNNRISVQVVSSDEMPIVDAVVALKKQGVTIFSAKTDNKGKAELWVDLFQTNTSVDFSKLTVDINNGAASISNVKAYNDGINKVVVAPTTSSNQIDIAFVVDATGSMGDELEYLKTELLDVITRVKSANATASLQTASVFYRDERDEYVTRVSGFASDVNTTINFIKAQSAAGGGDIPEAVHSALDKSINELQWSSNAKTRLLFLLLDAPPHHNSNVIGALQSSITKANEKGIKIIPITASGIDKETEFLMRFMAMSTNGTYVFITNHSGVGDSHLEPTIGAYDVEYLNNLMVRLINKYAQ